MPIKLAVLNETRAGEQRVALVPSVVDKVSKLGVTVCMQSGAGDAVKLPDAAFRNVTFIPSLQELLREADIVLAVQPPSSDAVQAIREGAIA